MSAGRRATGPRMSRMPTLIALPHRFRLGQNGGRARHPPACLSACHSTPPGSSGDANSNPSLPPRAPVARWRSRRGSPRRDIASSRQDAAARDEVRVHPDLSGLDCVNRSTSFIHPVRGSASTWNTDAIVRVLLSCICGSDLWPYGGKPDQDHGDRIGHEFLGVVEDSGAGVSGVKPGDVVVAPFVWADNTCDFCREGLQTSCRRGGNWGSADADGGQGAPHCCPPCSHCRTCSPPGTTARSPPG